MLKAKPHMLWEASYSLAVYSHVVCGPLLLDLVSRKTAPAQRPLDAQGGVHKWCGDAIP